MGERDELLERFLAGDADEAELRILLERVRADRVFARTLRAELDLLGHIRGAAVSDTRLASENEQILRLVKALGGSDGGLADAVMQRVGRQAVSRRRWLRVGVVIAAVAAAIAVAFVAHLRSPQIYGRVGSVGVGFDLLRDGQTLPVEPGMKLVHDDLLVSTVQGERLEIVSSDETRIVADGELRLRLRRSGEARHLALEGGHLRLHVSPQPEGAPLVIATAQARATILGTTFDVWAGQTSTRLEVESGAVLFANHFEDRAIVEAGQFAEAHEDEQKLRTSETLLEPPPAVVAGFRRWRAWSDALRSDPTVTHHYTFQRETIQRGMLTNLAADDDPVFPASYDGRIYDCAVTDGRFPGLKQSLLFQQGAYVDCGVTQRFDAGEPFSCMIWFCPLFVRGSWTGLLTTGLQGWGLQIAGAYPAVNFYYRTEGGYENARSKTPFGMDTWHLAVGVFDGHETRVYLDGALVGTSPVTKRKMAFADPLVIGSNHDRESIRNFQGWIDEVVILTRAVTDDEVRAAWIAGNPAVAP